MAHKNPDICYCGSKRSHDSVEPCDLCGAAHVSVLGIYIGYVYPSEAKIAKQLIRRLSLILYVLLIFLGLAVTYILFMTPL